jgi:hypothetical protein
MPGRRTRTAWREATPLDRVLRSPAVRRFFAARAVGQRGRLVQRRRYRHPCLPDHRLRDEGRRRRRLRDRPGAAASVRGGAATARLLRRRVLVTADLRRAGMTAFLAFFHSQLWTVYAAAFGPGPLWRLTPDRAPGAAL